MLRQRVAIVLSSMSMVLATSISACDNRDDGSGAAVVDGGSEGGGESDKSAAGSSSDEAWVPQPCTPPSNNECPTNTDASGPNCFRSTVVNADGSGNVPPYVTKCSTESWTPSYKSDPTLHASAGSTDIWLEQTGTKTSCDSNCENSFTGRYIVGGIGGDTFTSPEVTMATDPSMKRSVDFEISGWNRGTFCGHFKSGSSINLVTGSFDFTGTTRTACY
jgi:hypothetical protein